MNSASERDDLVRALGLLIGAAVFEIFVLSETMFRLLKALAQWPLFPQLVILALPRFVVMALLVAVIGRFQKRSLFVVFLVTYAVLLLVRFDQAEVLVEWDSTIGAGRATLPYVSGLLGALLGFWLRRKSVISRPAAQEKPSSHG